MLAYSSPEEVVFGRSKHPVKCGFNVVIGDGEVIPEVNFTLPSVKVCRDNLREIRKLFRDITTRVLMKCVELSQEQVVVELEHVFEMTQDPQFGAVVTKDIKETMAEFHEKYGLRSALRVTVADIRHRTRPPRMRNGEEVEKVFESFRMCADAGADILSIESTGGKEITDRAIVEGDVEAILFVLGVMAIKDMEFLWREIVNISERFGVVPGGDTACGFANTAMQLANMGMIPRVMAALVRLASVPRSYIAVKMGAKGPLKDCGYENPAIKMLCGVPISMEGKASACAHSSPLGNIAAATCDLWSNESVQDVKLLGGDAPEVFTEILIYDCRLMNAAAKESRAFEFRDLLVASDKYLDPQALMLDPDLMYRAAQIVENVKDPYHQVVETAKLVVDTISQETKEGRLRLTDSERRWLGKLGDTVYNIPSDWSEILEHVEKRYEGFFLMEEYGLP
ncbi:MAG: hypothetical protein J7L52_02890 [Thermotogae bacterium]|nr:hypothetical protein [Thermotogota bacterium]